MRATDHLRGNAYVPPTRRLGARRPRLCHGDFGRSGQRTRGSLAQATAAEVARRAGHSVVVLLKIYAHCIDGQADAANKRITDALDGDDGEDEHR
jgi:hypothetical protein